MAMVDRYDSALLGILQSEGQIGKFLDTVYGFLYRKTDFYLLMKDKSARMGFPPGVGLQLSVGAFKKYEELAKKNEAMKIEMGSSMKNPICDQRSADKKKAKDHDDGNTKPCQKAEAKVPKSPSQQKTPEVHVKGPDKKTNIEAAKSEVTKPIGDKTPNKHSQKSEDDEDNDTELTKMQKEFQANPASYNGALHDNYSWSQSIGDVDVQVKVPVNVKKGADVKVLIEKKKLKISHRDDSGMFITIVDGDLTWDINKEESMWTLSPSEHIHINFEKCQERWWDALLVGEPKISVRKIDPSRPITDLDDEAQAKIEEMMYNEHQKRLGKPQTHETKVHDMLKKAWDAEGSPFKGQPFNPSVVKVANQGEPGGSVPLPNP